MPSPLLFFEDEEVEDEEEAEEREEEESAEPPFIDGFNEGIPFRIKWIFPSIDFESCPRISHPYFIPGCPGLKYQLETRVLYDCGFSLRLSIFPSKESFKNYVILVRGVMKVNGCPKKFSKEFNDLPLKSGKGGSLRSIPINNSFADKFWDNSKIGLPDPEEEDYFGERNNYKKEGEKFIKITVKGEFYIQKMYSKEIKMDYKNGESICGEEIFTLVAGKKEIKINKSILAQNSAVFAKMFENQSPEKVCNDERKYAIPDFSFKIVDSAVNFLCGKNNEAILSKEEEIQLFQFAEKYQMKEFRKSIKESIIFTPKNICDYFVICYQNQCDEIGESCIEYLLHCSQFGVFVPDFSSLPLELRALYADKTFNCQNLKLQNCCIASAEGTFSCHCSSEENCQSFYRNF